MADYNVCVLIVLTIVLIWMLGSQVASYQSINRRCNEADGRCYSIVGAFDPSTHAKASELLGRLNIFAIELLRHLRKKYIFDAETHQSNTQWRQAATMRLISNYNPDNIIENNPPTSENTSYVQDKGKVFAMCLREKKTLDRKFHNITDLEFVLMHEMAHLAALEFGHETEFWTTFKFLLVESTYLGYVPVDYSKRPFEYCSLQVTYSPYFDPTLNIEM